MADVAASEQLRVYSRRRALADTDGSVEPTVEVVAGKSDISDSSGCSSKTCSLRRRVRCPSATRAAASLAAGDRCPKRHVPRPAKHQLTLIRIVARGRTKHRDEDKPHTAGVLRIGAALKNASIHYDHANGRRRLVRS